MVILWKKIDFLFDCTSIYMITYNILHKIVQYIIMLANLITKSMRYITIGLTS